MWVAAHLAIVGNFAQTGFCGTIKPRTQSFLKAADLPAPPPGWTIGNKHVVVLRLEFPDRLESAPSEEACRTMMDYAGRVLWTNSYGALTLDSTISPALKFPKPEAQYANTGEITTTAWQLANDAGIHQDDFDLEVVVGFRSSLSLEGFATVGGRGLSLRSAAANYVIVHELGHNLGLMHANGWIGANLSITGPGTHNEYGDNFDIMGSGQWTYSSWEKVKLGWLPTNSVFDVTNTVTVTLHNHQGSTSQPGAIYALRIPAGDKSFWVDCQAATAQIPQLADSVVIRWEPWAESHLGTHLLDMTPETGASAFDASLVVGRTFSDRKRKIHITPLEKTADGFSVEVRFGDFPDDQPPIISTPFHDVMQVNVGAAMDVSAAASDPDGDPVSITWNFGDGGYGIGPNATHVFLYEGEFSVRCEASDHKGGVATKSFVAQAGSPAAYRVSGIVTRKGVPLSNACIYVAGTEVSARTDADGRYVLPGLSPGAQTLKGAYDGAELRGKGFANPYVATGVQTGIDWEYPELRAFDLNLQIAEDSAATAVMLAGESPTGSMTYEFIDPPAHGVLRGTLPALTYTPDLNFSGADSFTFRVNAEDDESLPAQVSINVTPTPDLPLVFGKVNGRAEATSTTHWTPEAGEMIFVFNGCVGRDGRAYVSALKSGGAGNDVVVRCIDTKGGVAWDRALNFAKYDIPIAIVPHGDGIVVSTTAGADSLLTRISGANELLWTYILTNGTSCLGEARGEDALMIAGTQGSAFVAKLDAATGRELWRKPAPATLAVNHLDSADDGSFVVTGSLDLGGGGLGGAGNGRDIATLKFSENGDLVWSRTFGTENIESGIQTYEAADGSIYTWGGWQGSSDTSLIHYGPDGQTLWQSDPINGAVSLVFDGNDTPIVLAGDSLLQFSTRVPRKLWTPANAPVSLNLTRDGFFEILTAYSVDGENGLWLTTLDSTGRELSSVPLRHSVIGLQWTKALPDPNGHAFFLIDGAPLSFSGTPRVVRFVNEALPLSRSFPAGDSTPLGALAVGLDDGDLGAEITAPPAHGLVSGEWPNWIFTPAPGFTGEDRIGLRTFQAGGQAASGELDILVNKRPELFLNQSADGQSITLTASTATAGLEWSKDLKAWSPVRGQTGAAPLTAPRTSSARYFRISQ